MIFKCVSGSGRIGVFLVPVGVKFCFRLHPDTHTLLHSHKHIFTYSIQIHTARERPEVKILPEPERKDLNFTGTGTGTGIALKNHKGPPLSTFA